LVALKKYFKEVQDILRFGVNCQFVSREDEKGARE